MALEDAQDVRRKLKDKGFDSRQVAVLAEIVDELLTSIETATSTNTSQATSITNLNTWATALATKLNADAGVTDADYDTNPQA